MIPGYLVAAAVAGLLTILTYTLGYRRSARRYDIIVEVPTVQARDVPGLGAAMVEVKGRALVDEPLTSDLARLPCVAFDCRVTEHWTTTRTERDSKGHTRTVTEHHSETRYANSGRISFQVEDDSGRVTVQPDGASIDMLDGLALADIRKPLPDSPAYGLCPHHLGGHLSYHEQIFPVGQQAYVLGQVSIDHAIVCPEAVSRPFIISHHDEAVLIHRARWGKRIYGAMMFLLFAAAFILLGLGLGIIREWWD